VLFSTPGKCRGKQQSEQAKRYIRVLMGW